MWNKEKHKELKKLKRSGYTREQLVEHFGVDIYESGYFQKSHKLSFLKDYTTFKINEIIISQYTEYTLKKEKSLFNNEKSNIIINFKLSNEYVLILFYVLNNDIESYEILFSSKENYDKYIKEMNKILELPGKHFTDEEQEILKHIVEKETNFNELIPLMKSLSFILFDVYKDYNFINTFSISETENPIKIKVYRDIIKNSFKNVEEYKKTDTFYYKII